MKISKIVLIFGIIALLGALTFILYNSKKEIPQEKLTTSKVGLWEGCDPQINNCENGLECKGYGVTDIYRCIKYLKKGEECGLSEAEVCSEGLVCVDTDKTRQRCGTFSTEGAQECFIESFQVCKPI